MHFDAAGESLRLAEEYRAKSDDELRELAADFSDLTEPAQQALRQEMQSRKLGDPQRPVRSHQAPSPRGARRTRRMRATPRRALIATPWPSRPHRCQGFSDAQPGSFPTSRMTVTKTMRVNRTTTLGKPFCAIAKPTKRLSTSMQRYGMPGWKAGFRHRANSVGATLVSLSPPTSLSKPAPSPPGPFRRTSLTTQRRRFRNLSNPNVPNAVQTMSSSKRSTRRTNGGVSNAMRSGVMRPTSPETIQRRRPTRPHKNGKSRPAIGGSLLQGE